MIVVCPECGKRTATIHYTKIVNGNKTEYHLCEICAQEKGDYFSPLDDTFSFNQLLSGLINFGAMNGAHTAKHTGLQCSNCGLTYQQFSKIGRFGCSQCYRTFQDRLDPLLRRLHGQTKHHGKIPNRAQGKLKLQRDLAELREKLNQCIQAEEFEKAAKIRDQIRSIQDRLES